MKYGLLAIVGVLLLALAGSTPINPHYHQQCSGRARIFRCVVNPCRGYTCSDNTELRCVPNYCDECGRLWLDDSDAFQTCSEEVQGPVRRRGQGRAGNRRNRGQGTRRGRMQGQRRRGQGQGQRRSHDQGHTAN